MKPKKAYEIQRDQIGKRLAPYKNAAKLIHGFNTLGMDPDSPEYAEKTRGIIIAAEALGLKNRFKEAGITLASVKKAHNGSDPEVPPKACEALVALIMEKL